MFQVSDEVVCVNDDNPEQSAPPFVIRGRTYTVSAVEVKPWPVQSIPVPGGMLTIVVEMEFIWVVGLPSETGHFAFRFHKVEKQSKTTDISVFRKILDKVPENVQ